jgi:hypothetical protein
MNTGDRQQSWPSGERMSGFSMNPKKKRVSGSLVLVASVRELAIPGVAWQQKRNRGSNWDRGVFGFRLEQS